jgi:hypothetical protein
VTVSREIHITVAGTEARLLLTDDRSPKAAQTFWDRLPIETTIAPAKFSGRAGFFVGSFEPSAGGVDLECPVCSIYPGYLVMRPEGNEFLLAYGVSESRWMAGTEYVTPVARVIDGFGPLVAVLASMHNEGQKPIRVRRAELGPDPPKP